MSMLNRTAAFVISSCLMLSATTSARSEPCEMLGCVGALGYIFLPDPILITGRKLPTYTLGTKRCAPPPADAQTFTTAGLPEVNTVAILKSPRRGLFTDSGLDNFASSFEALRVEPSEAGQCSVEWHEPQAPRTLAAGARLRILGYRTLPPLPKAHMLRLFVLVVVEADQ